MTIIIGFILVLLGAAWFLASGPILGRQKLNLTPRNDPHKIAILIPARDESAVIEGLLKSLAEQTVLQSPKLTNSELTSRPSYATSAAAHRAPYTMRDIYVIVETDRDPTVKICREYGASVIVRPHPEKQRKGYALDEAIKQILAKAPNRNNIEIAANGAIIDNSKSPLYDAYFIFDADNRLAPNYFEKIFTSYRQGYQLATGYRHSKNANTNVISAVSSLTFSMINVMSNAKRIKRGGNIIFSGTGFYVDGHLVETWRGWPFHSLTEDYELSLYATLHGFSTYYNDTAVFYDEQPTSYLQTVAQRTRWIKGYFSARAKYIPLMRQKLRRSRHLRSASKSSSHRDPSRTTYAKVASTSAQANNLGSLRHEIVGVKPVITMLVGVVVMFLGGLIELCARGEAGFALLAALAVFALVYFVLMFITIEMIKREKLKLTPEIRRSAILFNPIYLVTYVYCALKALLVKNVKWTRIEHGK